MKLGKKISVMVACVAACLYAAQALAADPALIGPDLPTRLGGAVRSACFSGSPIPVYTRVGTVTAINLPRPPVRVAAGGDVGSTATGEDMSAFAKRSTERKGGSYTLSISGNTLFINCNKAKAYSNIICKTESETYLFTLLEVSLANRVAWDSELTITDPFKYWNLNSPKTLVQMMYDMRIPTDFYLQGMKIVRPGITDLLYDEDREVAVKVSVEDCLLMPKKGKSVWRLRISNVQPKYLTESTPLKPFAVLPEGLNVKNVPWTAVAVPTGDNTYLAVGEGIDVFIFAKNAIYPPKLDIQLEVNGAIMPFTIHLPDDPEVVAKAKVEPRREDPSSFTGRNSTGGVGMKRIRMHVVGGYRSDGTYTPAHDKYFFVRTNG